MNAYTRIMDRVVAGPGGCMICTYSVGSHGYCQAWNGVTVVLAHRIVWEHHYGPIPTDMTVDHRCHVRRCVNPAHLRLLPNSANASDNGMVAFRTNSEVGRSCRRGHPLVAQSTDGRTYCRECKAAGKRRRRAAL